MQRSSGSTGRPKAARHVGVMRITITLVLSLAIALGGTLWTATPIFALTPGDIAIIGVRADDIDATTGNGNDDAFAWVPLVNLAPGAEIYFTDSGWTAGNTFRTEEGAIRYTAPPGGLAAGTVMLLELTNVAGLNNYLFTPSGGGGTYTAADNEINPQSILGFAPATPGDNVFIFEGSGASPTFVWAWKNDGPYDADSTSNSTTALPASLTEGVNAMTIELTEDGSDNSRYVGPTTGTAAQLAAAIANPANWEKSETFPFPSGGSDITNGTLSGGGFTVIGAPTPTPTDTPIPTDTPTPIPPTPTNTPTDTPTPIPPTPTNTPTNTPIPPTPTNTPTDTPTPIPPTPTNTPTDTPTPIPPTPTNTPTNTPIPPTPTPSLTPTPANQPPICGGAVADPGVLLPPNHKFRSISIKGVTDPDGDPVTLTVTAIFQDEAVDAVGSGQTAPDGQGLNTSTPQVRAERVEDGNGRVYHIVFIAADGNGGSCIGEVLVGVPPDRMGTAVDDGALFDSTTIP